MQVSSFRVLFMLKKTVQFIIWDMCVCVCECMYIYIFARSRLLSLLIIIILTFDLPEQMAMLKSLIC